MVSGGLGGLGEAQSWALFLPCCLMGPRLSSVWSLPGHLGFGRVSRSAGGREGVGWEFEEVGGQVLALPGLMPKGVDSELWSGHPPGGGALTAGRQVVSPFASWQSTEREGDVGRGRRGSPGGQNPHPREAGCHSGSGRPGEGRGHAVLWLLPSRGPVAPAWAPWAPPPSAAPLCLSAALPPPPNRPPWPLVGGPHSPLGWKGPQPSRGGGGGRIPPARHPVGLLPGGLQLPRGGPASTWAPTFIAALRGRPGWQIFGDCIVIADWANRARLL